MAFSPDPELIERARNPVRGPDGRLPTRDRVETAILRAPPFAARGAFRDELVLRRTATEVELRATDAELAGLVERRRALVQRIHGCNLALVGTGEIRDRETGETLQVLGRWHERIPFVDPQPDHEGSEVAAISGARLRTEVVRLLRSLGQPLALDEIERLLRLMRLVPMGRPSQTISNAMRPAVRSGRVAIVERGVYEFVA